MTAKKQKFKNHKLSEVLCAFRFNTEREKDWNIGKFSEFFNKIEQLGFKYAEERVQVKVSVNLNMQQDSSDSHHERGMPIMVYKNESENEAILMEKGYLSIHSLHNSYDKWESFKPKIEKYLEAYQSLGLGKELKSVQIRYINDFEIKSEDKLSTYLSFAPQVPSLLDSWKSYNHYMQSNFVLDKNTYLDLTISYQDSNEDNEEYKKVMLEIKCTTTLQTEKNLEWKEAVEQVHGYATETFSAIAKDEYKSIIK